MFSGGMKCFLESDYFFPHHCSVKHALLISCFKLVLQENPRLQNLFRISLFMCYMNHCLNTFLLYTAFHGTPPSVSHCWMNVLHPRSLCSRSNQSVLDPKVSTGISPDSPVTEGRDLSDRIRDWFWKVAANLTGTNQGLGKLWGARCGKHCPVQCPSVARWPMLKFLFFIKPFKMISYALHLWTDCCCRH